MNKMGIKINLSAIFQDERQMVYIMVDPKWESVESLQKRVEYLFNVDSVRFLSSDGYYLPPQESIEIIKYCEGLRAFVPKESLERHKKKKAKKSKCEQKSPQESDSGENLINIGEIQERDDVKKKRKYYSLGSIQDAGIALNNAKRLKGSNAINEILAPIQNDNKCMEITSTSEQIQTSTVQTKDTVEAGSRKKMKTKHSKDVEGSDDVDNGHQSQSSVIIHQNASSSEQKRELIIEKGTDTGKEEIFNNNTKTSARSTNTPSSTFLNESKTIAQKHSPNLNNSFRKQLSNNAHIYFNGSGKIVSTTNKSQSKNDKETKTIVIFRCPLQEITNIKETPKPRIFFIERNSSYNKKKKQLVEIKESIVLAPIPNLVFDNKNSLAKESAATNSEHEKKNTKICKTNAKVNLLKEKTDLRDTTIVTESKNIVIALDNHIEKSQIETNTEVALNEQNSMSVDCVDLSMEPEEGDATKTKFEIIEEKHDITSAKNANDSSSDIEEISEIIDLNETEDNCNSTFRGSPAYSRYLHDIRVDKVFPFCTNMSKSHHGF